MKKLKYDKKKRGYVIAKIPWKHRLEFKLMKWKKEANENKISISKIGNKNINLIAVFSVFVVASFLSQSIKHQALKYSIAILFLLLAVLFWISFMKNLPKINIYRPGILLVQVICFLVLVGLIIYTLSEIISIFR